jgi:hypothetical protein
MLLEIFRTARLQNTECLHECKAKRPADGGSGLGSLLSAVRFGRSRHVEGGGVPPLPRYSLHFQCFVLLTGILLLQIRHRKWVTGKFVYRKGLARSGCEALFFESCIYFSGWEETSTPRKCAGLTRGFDGLGLDRRLRCRAGPLRGGGRSLRDLYIPFGLALPLVARENLRADQREAQGEAGLLPTKWALPA